MSCAWFLYEELWDLSTTARPELAAAERRARIDELLDPLLDAGVRDADRAWLLVDVFRSVLAGDRHTFAYEFEAPE
jgi:hypothetical protein